MEVNNLQTTQKDIIKNIRLLLNSKFESRSNLIVNNGNFKLNLIREYLLPIFNNKINKKEIREYVKNNSNNDLIIIDCDKGIFITSEMRINSD